MLTTVYSFVIAHWSVIISFLFALHAAAVIIVNATPTEIDNKVLAVVHRILVFLADLVPNTKTGTTAGAPDSTNGSTS